MQLGFVSAILPDLPLDRVLYFAADEGYDCVEVMCWPPGKAERRYAGVTHIDVAALDDAAVQRIADLVSASGVSISALGYYPNSLSADPDEAAAAVRHLRAVIAAAPKLGLDRVTTFVGRDPARAIEDQWPRFIETWQPLVALAEQNGVRLGIEHCPMSFTRNEWPGGKNLAVSPSIWRKMFDQIPSPAWGLNYDPSHMIWQMMDYLAPLREFADRLVHVHAKDARLDRERLNQVGVTAYPLEFHTPKLPGMGDVDWGRFFSVLTDVGYHGPVCVEVEDRAYEGSLEARQAALRQSAAYLRNFIPRRSR